jgi:hypothetical protein
VIEYIRHTKGDKMIDKNIRFDYSLDKDALLRSERGVDFDVVISKLREQVELIITPHPNFEKYPNQVVFEILIQDYVYCVPAVKTSDGYFLKTIYRSRKATKAYSRGI